MIRLELAGTVVEATGNHPFWVITGESLSERPEPSDVYENERECTPRGRWVEARHLQLGDVLLLCSGQTETVQALDSRQASLSVYNIAVEGFHTYAVGRDGVLVHNKPRRASRIDRKAFRREREAYWKNEAKRNSRDYSPTDLKKMKRGKAPVGADGHPRELHHVDRTPEGGVRPMDRTDHRLGDNYRKNHP